MLGTVCPVHAIAVLHVAALLHCPMCNYELVVQQNPTHTVGKRVLELAGLKVPASLLKPDSHSQPAVKTAYSANRFSRVSCFWGVLLHEVLLVRKASFRHRSLNAVMKGDAPCRCTCQERCLAGLQKRALMVALAGLRGCLRTICVGVTAPRSALPLSLSLRRSSVSAETANLEKSSPAQLCT